MKNLIICDKCGHIFNYMNVRIKSRIVDKIADVREQYYKCPKCNAKYTTMITDPEIRRLIDHGEKYAAKLLEDELKKKYFEKG